MAQKFDKLGYLQILRGTNLTHAQYRLLVTMLGYSDEYGCNAHPGYARLSKECRMSKGTISKCLSHLKRSGWLWESAHKWPSSDGREASVYELRIPKYLAIEEFPDGTTSSIYKPSSDDVWTSGETWGA
ncbi:helix-turn-helix domain-containing protein [Mycolicibacterium septicum]|uniref:helix-turn-helix domain-containing protein n=1 Tax=Mycolicibacterium septicum TaxID=98668 RepID=UPI001AFC326C|nr:helix-turn-helix domain-containing protein [Mycolicibacterium septicum]